MFDDLAAMLLYIYMFDDEKLEPNQTTNYLNCELIK